MAINTSTTPKYLVNVTPFFISTPKGARGLRMDHAISAASAGRDISPMGVSPFNTTLVVAGKSTEHW